MGAPPSLKQIDTSKMDDAPEWFREAFLQQLNPFLRGVVALFSGQLTRGENVRGEEREISFKTGGSVAIDTSPFPLFLSPQSALRPRHVTITCPNLESVPTGAAQPVWELESDGRVKIRLITGLAVSTEYKMRFLLE